MQQDYKRALSNEALSDLISKTIDTLTLWNHFYQDFVDTLNLKIN
jgi:hypothetical protein